MKKSVLALVLLLAAGCRTVGVSRGSDGYAEIAPAVANEMLLDTNQVVILDVRTSSAYRGPAGHIAGSISAPFESIERQLPELLPYQKDTVLVYGDTGTDGAVASKVLAAAGFKNVVHLQGGLHSWVEHGYRTVNSQ